MADRVDYDEFGLFGENAEEYGLPFDRPPTVRRVFTEVAGGRRLSALVWQERDPELVLLHGGSQNAHTWDTVAMALDRPLVAIDLPGHGHSDGPAVPREGQLDIQANAADVATVDPPARPGRPGGGRHVVRRADDHRAGGRGAGTGQEDRPGRRAARGQTGAGPAHHRLRGRTDQLRQPGRAAGADGQFNPTRSRSSLRRGILHNAEQQPDGTSSTRPGPGRPCAGASCTSRTAARRHLGMAVGPAPPGRRRRAAAETRYEQLWEELSAITVPVLLARGMRPDSVLDDDNERELLRRLPSAQVVHVEGAGHSLQGDTPLELAGIIERFVFGSGSGS